MKTKYKNLFSPLTIRGITIKNRIEAAPISVFDLARTKDQHPSDRDMAFFRVRAMGGAGIVTLGDCIVHPSGQDTGHLPSPKILIWDDDNLPFITQIADEIHRYGALASVELNHAGMLSTSYEFDGWGPDDINFYEEKTIAPLTDQSDSDEPVYRQGIVKGMTEEMIETVVDAFGTSALRAKTCGFDMAMIHAGHGWLIHQFLSPFTNHRTDRFGGSLENRMRLLLMIIDRIRSYCGEDFLIEVRFSGSEFIEGGITLKESSEFAKMMDGKADILHVSVCNFYFPETECEMVPTMFAEHGQNVFLGAGIKAAVKESKVLTLGALTDPQMMEDIISSGKADLVGMCRTLNADPMFPDKVRKGKDDEVRPCMRCSACIANYQTRITKCAVNPTLHRPNDVLWPMKPSEPQTVLVAGGGPGGMGAAIVAAERGHRVILCEKRGELGGLLRYSRIVPFKKDTELYLDYLIGKVNRLGVEARLNTEVTPALLEELQPDVCIAAVGSQALVPKIPGIENAHPIMDMYDKTFEVGQNIVIVGGGLAGSEATLELAMQGKHVTLVEMGSDIARDANSIHKPSMLHHMADYKENIDIMKRSTCDEIRPDSVVVTNHKTGETIEIKADTVIYAIGMTALVDTVNELREVSDEFRWIGDCKKARNIQAAIHEAYDASMSI